ncbi:hypothetical protein ARMGADRAFT_1084694 [Armillaria gallica]|uniref:Uncharacterized protein n=1 Tax=Armillaria gallica TaxID=47427 RepID=A0A2H3DAB0_ARMGA|nr:hypothetical protein ARMGADRAFT_1084694 [Armillaria gallica]
MSPLRSFIDLSTTSHSFQHVAQSQKCHSTSRVHDHVLPSSLVTDLRDGIQIRADAHAESIRRTLDGLQPKLCEYDPGIEMLEENLRLQILHYSNSHASS